jgi:ABC-type lipoprotein export system ATPase subunit
MIEVTELEFEYPRTTFRLRVPELKVRQGETVAVIGPSGSGKTTLLNLIAGILVPSCGCVTTNGVEVSSLGESARRDFRVRQIGLAFQEFELLEHLNVLDNILLPCRITSSIQLKQKHEERAIELAGEMGLDDKLRRYVRKLSQGERQRVALCRALLLNPPLLLCDEPTGNLDPQNKEHVLDILFDYVCQHETTLLTVTHDHQLLPRFAKTIDLSERTSGRMKAEG